jgi:hypothetical protein
LSSEPVELVALDRGSANEMDAYERVLGDAMAGDATLFAREDYVEEAWRIVDPLLEAGTPVYGYSLVRGVRRRCIRELCRRTVGMIPLLNRLWFDRRTDLETAGAWQTDPTREAIQARGRFLFAVSGHG